MSPPHPHVHCLLCIVTQAQQAMQNDKPCYISKNVKSTCLFDLLGSTSYM